MTPPPITARIRSRAPDPGDDGRRDLLREALSRWATGVTLLTVDDEGDVQAMVVSAFTPVSLDPPRVLVCVTEGAAIVPSLLDVGRFSVHVLAEDQHALASSVASGLPLPPSAGAGDADPALAGALVTLACTVHETHPGGDHRIVVGAVEAVHLGSDAPPLLYHRRRYAGIRD